MEAVCSRCQKPFISQVKILKSYNIIECVKHVEAEKQI